MQKILGILGLLVFIFVVTALGNKNFLGSYNLSNQLHHASMLGIIGIGAALVIIGGGIDLSIGSVICLTGCLLAWLMSEQNWSAPAALSATLALATLLGLTHGLLIVVARLQPFVVTLCGMLMYRGISRWFTQDRDVGFGDRIGELNWLVKKMDWTRPFLWVSLSPTFVIMAVMATLALIALNQSVFGRYLLAVGRNEQAARYSGINTGRITIVSYVVSGLAAGIAGVLYALDTPSVQPASQGLSYEFYAIAAAVLGGCSLRGGEGSILGVVIGAAILQLLSNSLTLLGVSDRAVDIVIGLVILGGVAVDEAIRRLAARRRSA